MLLAKQLIALLKSVPNSSQLLFPPLISVLFNFFNFLHFIIVYIFCMFY